MRGEGEWGTQKKADFPPGKCMMVNISSLRLIKYVYCTTTLITGTRKHCLSFTHRVKISLWFRGLNLYLSTYHVFVLFVVSYYPGTPTPTPFFPTLIRNCRLQKLGFMTMTALSF